MANNTRIVVTAEDKTKAALDSVVGNLGQLQGALDGLDSISGRLPAIGAGIAAAFGGISFAGIIKGSIDYADSLDELSQRTGVSVETLSSLRNAAELSGTSLEGVGKEVQKLTRNMTDAARGSATQVENFRALGVAVTDNQGNLRSSSDVMLELARAVGELEDPTERVIAAQLAFGKSGGDLVPLLLELSQNGLQAAEVTAEQAAEAAMLNDQLDIMRQQTRAAGEAFSLTLLPVFAAVVDVAQGAGFAIKQMGSSLAVVAKDVQTAVSVIGTALSEGPTQRGRDKVRELLAERNRFVEAANEDLQDRALRYQSTLDLVLNPPETAAARSGTSKLSERLKRLREETERSSAGSSAAVKKQVDAMLRRQEEAARQVRDILDKMEFDPEQDKMLGDMNRQLEQTALRYREIADPAAKYREQLDEIQALGQRLRDDGSPYLDPEQVEQATLAVRRQMGELEETNNVARELGFTFNSAFEDAIVKGNSFRDVLDGIYQDILRIIVRQQISEPFSRAIGGLDFGGMLGGLFGGGYTGADTGAVDLGGSIDDFLAGFRADGGPVSAGRRYVVGERGPELFVPNASGTIIPNEALGGSAPRVSIQVINQGTPQQYEQQGMDWDGESLVLSLVASDIERDGQVGQAMSRRYGLSRGAGAY